ncbi:hypothetical protein AB4072_04880 [Microvirga sp. 2MCAF38]|uniref:hypothetical protein n=1 Tax=Microvirga sp. 2MCAF38 TaxID=3232989 RepID=UPI003F95835D
MSNEAQARATAIQITKSVTASSLQSAHAVADLSVALERQAERLGAEIGRFLVRVKAA